MQNIQSSLTESDEDLNHTDGDQLIKKKYSKEGKWRNSKLEETRGKNRRTQQVKNVTSFIHYKFSIMMLFLRLLTVARRILWI